MRANKFVWLGTNKVFDAFTFAFEKTEHGWIWAHAYRFAPDCSTFIVECSEETWRGFGFDRMDQAEAIAVCEKLFAKYLDGHSLQSNAAHLRGSAAWLNFRRIKCERWSTGNVILLGDAAHTAHFSVGSGTKLALEDAIKLAEVLSASRHCERREAIQKLWTGCRVAFGSAMTRPCRWKPPSTSMSPSGTSKSSSFRTARATRPSGSRRSSATRISSRCSSLTRC